MHFAYNLTITMPELSAVTVPVSYYAFSRDTLLTFVTGSAALQKLQGFPPSAAAACHESLRNPNSISVD